MKKYELWEIKNLITEYQKKYPNYQNFIDWNNTLLYEWEYKLLTNIGAINDNVILSNYPILEIEKSNGDSVYKDYDGDLQAIKQEIENIKQDQRLSLKAKITWCPRNFSLWSEIKKEEAEKAHAQKYAQSVNTPPVEAY